MNNFTQNVDMFVFTIGKINQNLPEFYVVQWIIILKANVSCQRLYRQQDHGRLYLNKLFTKKQICINNNHDNATSKQLLICWNVL